MSQVTTSHRATTAAGRPVGARPVPPASLRAVPAAVGRSRTGVFAVVCMALLAVGLVGLLLLNTALAQGAFTLQRLTETSRTLSNEEHALRQSVQEQSSSAALAQRAVQMGMVPARSMAFLRLSDGAILGVAEPAKAESFVVVTAPRPPAPAPAAPSQEQPPAAPAPDAPAAGTPSPASAPTPATTSPAAPTAGTTPNAETGPTADTGPPEGTAPTSAPTAPTAAPPGPPEPR